VTWHVWGTVKGWTRCGRRENTHNGGECQPVCRWHDITLLAEGKGISKHSSRWCPRPVSCCAACRNTGLMELLRPDVSSNKRNVSYLYTSKSREVQTIKDVLSNKNTGLVLCAQGNGNLKAMARAVFSLLYIRRCRKAIQLAVGQASRYTCVAAGISCLHSTKRKRCISANTTPRRSVPRTYYQSFLGAFT
jgi:hypothetical protein